MKKLFRSWKRKGTVDPYSVENKSIGLDVWYNGRYDQ